MNLHPFTPIAFHFLVGMYTRARQVVTRASALATRHGHQGPVTKTVTAIHTLTSTPIPSLSSMAAYGNRSYVTYNPHTPIEKSERKETTASVAQVIMPQQRSSRLESMRDTLRSIQAKKSNLTKRDVEMMVGLDAMRETLSDMAKASANSLGNDVLNASTAIHTFLDNLSMKSPKVAQYLRKIIMSERFVGEMDKTMKRMISEMKPSDAALFNLKTTQPAQSEKGNSGNNSGVSNGDKKDGKKDKDKDLESQIKEAQETLVTAWNDVRKNLKGRLEAEKEKEKDRKGSESDDKKDSKDEKDKDDKDGKKKSEDEESPFDFLNSLDPQKVMYWFFGLVVFFYALAAIGHSTAMKKSRSIDLLLADALDGNIHTIAVANEKDVDVYLHNATASAPSRHYRLTVPSGEYLQRRLDQLDYPANVVPPRVFHSGAPPTLTGYLATGLSFLIPIGFLFLIMRGAASGLPRNLLNVGKSNAFVVYNPKQIKVSFKDVAGCDQAKLEIMEFVDFLKHPAKYKQLGAKVPKGALLVGPPGTGKTLLAKATAAEAGVPFYSMSGSDFVEMFVGVGASRVRDLFSQARKAGPSIIFIDEIDAVGRKRSRHGVGGHDERENTLNQMLVEMDGFATGEGVIVLAATNRPELLDRALLRPGRFDRQISIDAPDIKGRADVFRAHMKPLKLAADPDEVATRMAALTPGMVGADIANVCNEAAIIATRRNKLAVDMADFEAAVDRIIGGIAKTTHVMSEEERKLVAFHESGHAIVGWLLERADPLLKVTIVPRTSGAQGFAQYLPRETALYQVADLEDRIAMALGGRAAELVTFNTISSGAVDDLKKTTAMAKQMITRLGMSDKLPNLNWVDSEENSEAAIVGKPYSDKTAELIDAEVQRVINTQFERAVNILKTNKDKLESLAKTLLDKETIHHDDLVEVLGERPFKSDSYRHYLKIQAEEKERRKAEKAKEEAEKKAQEEKEKEANANEETASETTTPSDSSSETSNTSSTPPAEGQSTSSPSSTPNEKDATPTPPSTSTSSKENEKEKSNGSDSNKQA